MQIGRLRILPWNRRNFIPRVWALVVIFGTIGFAAWGAYLISTDARVEQQQQQEEERIRAEKRRKASYRQRFRQQQQQQRQQNNVQNAIDGVRK